MPPLKAELIHSGLQPIEFVQHPCNRFVTWKELPPSLSTSDKLKQMSCFEKISLGWKTGSLYQKMGIIPIVSNIKGILEMVPSVLRTCTLLVCSVAVGALFIVSCLFSQCNKNLASIKKNLNIYTISKNTVSETLLGLTCVFAQYSVQNLTSASMYTGLIQQIPVFGNLKYAESLAEAALKKSEISEPAAPLPEETSDYEPFPDFDFDAAQRCLYVSPPHVDPRTDVIAAGAASARSRASTFDSTAAAPDGIATAISTDTDDDDDDDDDAASILSARSRTSTFSAPGGIAAAPGGIATAIKPDTDDDADDASTLSARSKASTFDGKAGAPDAIATATTRKAHRDSLSSLSIPVTDDTDASALSDDDDRAGASGGIATATHAAAGAASGGISTRKFDMKAFHKKNQQTDQVALFQQKLRAYFAEYPSIEPIHPTDSAFDF